MKKNRTLKVAMNPEVGFGAKKKLVTFHEQKPIDYLITKTYTGAKIEQIMIFHNM